MFHQITRTTLILLSTIASVTAHFTLDYPPTRGFDEDIEGQVSVWPGGLLWKMSVNVARDF